VKGSRISKPVAPSKTVEELPLEEIPGVLRSTVCKFSAGSGVFNPSFGKTEQIRMMRDNEIRQGSRMEWVKN